MERNILYLPSTSIRAIHCSQSLHEGDEDPNLSSEEMVDSTNHLHRRYSYNKSSSSTDRARYIVDKSSTEVSWFRDKPQEVNPHSNSEVEFLDSLSTSNP